jgi:hypothetical protein
MSEMKATLTIDGVEGAIDLPVYSGSLGPRTSSTSAA